MNEKEVSPAPNITILKLQNKTLEENDNRKNPGKMRIEYPVLRGKDLNKTKGEKEKQRHKNKKEKHKIGPGKGEKKFKWSSVGETLKGILSQSQEAITNLGSHILKPLIKPFLKEKVPILLANIIVLLIKQRYLGFLVVNVVTFGILAIGDALIKAVDVLIVGFIGRYFESRIAPYVDKFIDSPNMDEHIMSAIRLIKEEIGIDVIVQGLIDLYESLIDVKAKKKDY